MKSRTHIVRALIVVGTSHALSSAVLADPNVINISGANLLETFFSAPASTNDFIDVDADGIPFHPATPSTLPAAIPDQLAPFDVTLPFDVNQKWVVQYRSVNAGTGFGELVNWGTRYAENAGTSGSTSDLRYDDAVLDIGYSNRAVWKARSVNGAPGVLQAIANISHPGAAPFITSESTLLGVLTPSALGIAGARIDIASLDSPSLWILSYPGTPSVTALPGQSGFGSNSRQSINPATFGLTFLDANSQTVVQENKQQSLTSPDGQVVLNINTATPNAGTLFDTSLGYVISGVITNFGTGREWLSTTELQYLSTTGRNKSGENLLIITRDSNAGARNIFQASIGIDPSWGVGENVGLKDSNSAKDIAGPQFVPSNKGASGALENAVVNNRLAIGYTGADRGKGKFLTNGSAEFLGILDDVHTRAPGYSANPVRPYLPNIIHNGLAGQQRFDGGFNATDGYRLGGPETIVTLGDPRAASAALGGAGWPQYFYDPSDPRAVPEAVNTNPQVPNYQAAAYINNITRSVAAFNAAPGSDTTVFSPGEFLAFQYVLRGALDFIQDVNNPTSWVVNPERSTIIQNYTATNAAAVLADPAYQTFGFAAGSTSPAGKVPVRLALSSGQHYSDGVNAGVSFVSQGGATIAYSGNLKIRNLIAGDFNGDGLRNANDITDLIAAYRQRWAPGNPTWTAPAASGALATKAATLGLSAPGTDAIIEVLGDFTNDGNFDAQDVRYWADGLAIQTSGAHADKLDRKAGFIAVDNASLAAGGPLNFFSTILATGKPYTAGASRSDLVGPTRNTDSAGAVLLDAANHPRLDAFKTARGYNPVGADGIIDANDIDYIYANIRAASGSADWSSLNSAIVVDLSADINGDLKIDQNDVAELLTILGTQSGDVNLDGVANAADNAIITANLGKTNTPTFTVGWATGDVNGDGAITSTDLGSTGPRSDFNQSGTVTVTDIFGFLSAWFAGNITADFNQSGTVTVTDIFAFLSAWFAGI